jgi:hypothetical protein
MSQAPGPDAAELADLLAKQKITETLTRYCRGIDRCEIEALSSAFWPEATCDYGSGAQNALEWARATVAALKTMLRTQHAIGNILIEVDGDRARAETYCHAYHEVDGPDGRQEMVVGGRYLDRFERRGREWRITSRLYVIDWNQNGRSTSEWDTGLYAGLKRRGARWPDDALKAHLEGR